MEWKLLASTFSVVFLAEMGDKTQIATMALAGGSGSRWVVFAGAALALVATTVIAVLAGAVVSRYVPDIWIKRAAGATFIVLGLLYLLARPEPPAADPDGGGGPPAQVETAG